MKINKLFLAATGVLAVSSSAVSANLTWVDGDTNNTWDTAATSNWGGSAWSNATPDDAIFSGTGENITLGTGITARHLTFNATGYSIGSGILTLAGAAPGITTANDVTATISSNLAGDNGFTKTGAGTLTLSGVKTMTGAVIVNEGTLDLRIGVSGSVFKGVPLVLGGGTVKQTRVATVTGGTRFTSTTLNAGGSIAFGDSAGTTSTTGLFLGDITRNVGGTLLVSLGTGGGSFVQTTSTNTGGILGGYATFGTDTWAVGGNSGASTSLTGLTAYTVNGTLTNPANNIDIQAATVTATGSVANSLRFSTAGAKTLTLTGATTLTSGGILVATTVGNNAALITGGDSLAGAVGKDLIVHQNNTDNTLTIATPIVDNGGATGLTKSGAGTLILSGANTYTGVTTVNAGTLSLTGDAVVASGNNGVRIAPGATLTVAGTLKLASGTSKIANSGTLDLTSGTAVLDLNEQVTGITEGSTYNLFGTVGTISGKFKDIVGYTPDTSGLKARLDNTNGVITFKKVPEPSTYGLIGAGALAGVALVRRRRRRAGKIAA